MNVASPQRTRQNGGNPIFHSKIKNTTNKLKRLEANSPKSERMKRVCHFPHQIPVDDVFLPIVPSECVLEPFTSCMADHHVCRFHLDIVCNVDAIHDVDAKSFLKRGCFVCLGVCPCVKCCKRRKPKSKSYMTVREDNKVKLDARQLVFAYFVPEKRIDFANYKVPQRVPVGNFTDAMFEDFVIKRGVPIILTGMDKVAERKKSANKLFTF
jgi:hypothetical protein